MKILVIHQYFLEKEGAGGSRFNQFAKYWSKNGHQVTAIAGTVDYQTSKKPEKYKKKWVVKEKADSFTVFRCFVSESYNKNFLGRLWAYFSFTLSAIWAIIFFAGKQDIVIATSPPLFVAIPGYLAKIIKKIPLIFEIRDLWPKFAIDEGLIKNKLVIKLAVWLENFIYKKADLINVLTPAFKDYLIKEKRISENKIIYVPNGADLDIFCPDSKDNQVRKNYNWGNKFVILYVGAHGVANDLWQIIKAAELLKNNSDILFVLIGDGMEKPLLKKTVQEKGLSNVQFLDSVSKNKMKDFINASDVCTAILKKIYTTTYPNKVFDYMSCCKPIILPINGAARKLVVEEAQAGIFVKPENANEFKEAILDLYNNENKAKILGENGYNFVKENFDRQKLADRYLEIMSNLVRK